MKFIKAARKDVVKLLLAHAKLYILRRPVLKSIAFAVLARLQCLARRMRLDSQPLVATEFADLSPRARLIYINLKAAVKLRKE